LISDNGRGGIDGDGNGLRGMRERVRAIGGTLEIDSPRRGGTRLLVKAPVPVLRLVPSSPSTLPTGGSTATATSGHSLA
jgi:two-component system sensor histidine kinase DesK